MKKKAKTNEFNELRYPSLFYFLKNRSERYYDLNSSEDRLLLLNNIFKQLIGEKK